MLEQAARAAQEADRHGRSAVHHSNSTDEHWQMVARAVFESAREPTKEMIAAAAKTPGMREVENAIVFAANHGVRLTPDDTPPLMQAWRAMIDEILQEPGGE